MPAHLTVYVGSFTTAERKARGAGITVWRIDVASGAWRLVQTIGDHPNPSFLAFDRTERFLYSVHGDMGEVSAYAIDAASGELRLVNRQSCEGRNPVHLAVDPTNRHLAVANYRTGTAVILPIGPDGALGRVSGLVTLTGTPGPHRREQTASHPHDIPLDPSGRFFVVPDKGLDRIFVFRLDPEKGTLVAADPPSVVAREGAGPRHAAFHPETPLAYVLNELDSTVTAYRLDRESGGLTPLQLLTTLPDDFTGDNTGSEIAVAPSGRHLYASNRGHDSIAVFAIDPPSGRLSPIEWMSTEGRTPRFFALDPEGGRLYAANEDSDTIVAFGIDPASGRLTPQGRVAETGSPACIIFRRA
jgi:6-phosphogluconolactonase (cycloisomerase 2 family)